MMNKPDLHEAMYGAVRETAVIPRQPINMKPVTSIAGVQIRQLQVADQQPIPSQTPINIQRIFTSTGTARISVQFHRDPFDPSYSTTSVFVRTANGITALQGDSGEGPIVFVAAATSAPGAISLSTNSVSGVSTSTDFGKGDSRAVNRL